MVHLLQKLFRKESPPSSYEGKIEIFSRHCIFSSISGHKRRPPHFSHEACYRNLIQTTDFSLANLTLFLDLSMGRKEDHYLKNEKVVELHEGTEAGSFLRMLEHVMKLDLHPETILYFVEDDYVHRPGWMQILMEGFTVPGVDYVTLYDHLDKYTFEMYRSLESRLFLTPSTHWRVIPSTTQTFATKYKTLLRDLSIHRRFSENRKITQDHQKFLYLQRKKRMLISPIPGWSTHMEEAFLSPCVDWQSLINDLGVTQ